jgi:hypothetical protein
MNSKMLGKQPGMKSTKSDKAFLALRSGASVEAVILDDET